jgi:hypothetical protein
MASLGCGRADSGRQTEVEESITLQFPPTARGLGDAEERPPAAQRATSTATTLRAPSDDGNGLQAAAAAPTGAAAARFFVAEGRGSEGVATDEAPVVRGKPAAAAAAALLLPARRNAPRAPTLSSRSCLAILKRVKAVGGLSNEQLRSSAQQAKRAASKRNKAEQEKAVPMLGRLLAGASAVLEADVRRLQTAFDEAQAAVAAGTRAQADADERLQEAHKAELDGKAQLKDVEKAIETGSKAIMGAMTGKRSAQAEVAATQGRKRQLQEAAEKVYKPLKEARVEGRAAGKQISELCKVGKKYGLHSELLAVAPAILRKQLDKRQTFDNIAVKSLDAEFTKHVHALSSKIQDGEQSLQAHSETLDAKQAAVQAAREQRKECARKLTQAKADLRKSKENALTIRKRVKGLPLALSKAKLLLEQAKGRVSKFRCGPVAQYTRVLPLPNDAGEE